MKRLVFPLLILLAMGFTCPITGLDLGSEVDGLLPDPLIGLDTLDNYQAVLTIQFSGTEDGQAVETTDSYFQSEWPSLEAQFILIETSGEYDQPPFLLVGDVGEAHYFQNGSASPCEVRWGPLATDSPPLRLGSLLYPVGTARSAGQEMMDGISTQRYTFDGASLGLPDDVEASGEVWIVEQGGYVVKYSLQVNGSSSFFGEGKQGTWQAEYLLSEVNALPEVVYPQGCEPVLTEFPTMDDATEIIRLPGLLDFLSGSDLEIIAAFYKDQFESRGWEVAIDLSLEGEQALLIYTRADSEEVAFLSIEPQGGGAWVTISLLDPENDATTPPDITPDFSGDPVIRVTSGLSILLGMDTDQPGLPSYHMEAYHEIPAWAGAGIAQYEDQMVADVEGQNVHFKDQVIAPDGSMTISEAYLLGEEEYDVENGVIQPEGVSMTGLAWVLWPLDPAVILGTGASTAQPAGTEMLEGRTAEVYTVDSVGQMGAIAGVSLSVTAVSGTVWIDQETGALLKAELDYTAEVKDDDGNVKGSGTGRLEIDITRVGQVTVTLPVR